MNKSEIIDVLEDIALLLELKGENPFKTRAYQSGARTLESLEEDLGKLIEEEQLGSIKGIGKALVEKITTLYQTGELPYYTELKASIPPGMIAMLEIPSLGPKKIKKLHDALDIDSIEKLETACKAGELADLAGFGKKTEEKLLSGIANRVAYGKRHRWSKAFAAAEPILTGLRALPEVIHAEHAGSLRRKRETVGDLDFIVASEQPAPVMDWFTTQPDVQEVTAHGETKSSIRLSSGLQADLRVVPQAQFFSALHHFTGSKEHNVMMRQRALERGLSLSEWGLFPEAERGEDKVNKTGLNITAEADLFKALDLPFILPELREGLGEIEAAEANALPQLVEAGDIQGVFHNHTHASDGKHSLEEMTEAAQTLGLKYWGVADHSKASFQANGLDEERLLKQVEQIKELNASGKFATTVFSGSECDILKDGSLDFSNEILAQLDYVVVSVHNAFSLSEKEMTARIIKALENPHATMLGHLTGRLILRREPYALDAQKIIDAAIANGKIIELNANPMRLDMDWRLWRKASEKGLICSINPDAHNTKGLADYTYGVNVARKGWLGPENILNCWSLKEVKEYLKI